MTDNEVHSLDVLFNRLRNKTPEAQERMLEWLRTRLAEERRTKSAALASMNRPDIEPSEWRILWPDCEPSPSGTLPEIEEWLRDDWQSEDIVEVVGTAIVVQRFAVRVLTDDGPEYDMFNDRAKAEAFVAAMNEEARRPAPGDPPKPGADDAARS
jgi:hypothetical protein